MCLTAYALDVIVTFVIQLLTTDDFAEWFNALDDGAAEAVASTLEVIAELSPRAEAAGSSEWLLWYEHPGVSSEIPGVGSGQSWPPAASNFLNTWGCFLGYVKRIITHLESPQFVARLDRLPADDAAAVAAAVRRIRAASKARTRRLYEFMGGRSPARIHGAALGRFVDLTEIRQAYFEALAAAGFAVVDVPARSQALREIALRTRAPGLRILYGIDVRRSCGLVVVGEWLDRSFYGDSVRRAEQAWRRFLDGDLGATQVARSR